jgi:hypothetical protein
MYTSGILNRLTGEGELCVTCIWEKEQVKIFVFDYL